jgi:hypothetical protein
MECQKNARLTDSEEKGPVKEKKRGVVGVLIEG